MNFVHISAHLVNTLLTTYVKDYLESNNILQFTTSSALQTLYNRVFPQYK